MSSFLQIWITNRSCWASTTTFRALLPTCITSNHYRDMLLHSLATLTSKGLHRSRCFFCLGCVDASTGSKPRAGRFSTSPVTPEGPAYWLSEFKMSKTNLWAWVWRVRFDPTQPLRHCSFHLMSLLTESATWHAATFTCDSDIKRTASITLLLLPGLRWRLNWIKTKGWPFFHRTRPARTHLADAALWCPCGSLEVKVQQVVLCLVGSIVLILSDLAQDVKETGEVWCEFCPCLVVHPRSIMAANLVTNVVLTSDPFHVDVPLSGCDQLPCGGQQPIDVLIAAHAFLESRQSGLVVAKGDDQRR